MVSAALVPLSKVAEGESVTVVEMGGGRWFKQRLVSMGVSVGSTVKVLRANNSIGGPTLIAIGQTRLAIGRGMAERIMVRTSE